MAEVGKAKATAEAKDKSTKIADVEGLVKEVQELKLDIKELDKTMNRLADLKRREFQWRYIVPISLFRGLGTAIGATIIFALVLYVIGMVLAQLEAIPFIENILESIPWDQIIESSTTPSI